MSAVLKHHDCPACGQRHHFSFHGDDLAPGQEYEFLCPEKGTKAMLRPVTSGEIVHSPPQGAVPLTQPKVAAPVPSGA